MDKQHALVELKVGYCDESGSWPFVAASLSQRLPLRCIEWKNLVGATKFIDKLPLNFVAQNSLEALPLVCVYLVKCEDMEFYKATVKQRLGAWIEKMNAAKVEWMVLYVPLGTRAKGSASRNANNSVYKKIFDKIRADFAHKRPSATSIMIGAGSSANASSSSSLSSSSATGTSHSSERICKIEILEGNSIVGAAPGQHQQHESQWSELLLRLRHCIMDAFQTKCYQYEEEVRVLDTKVRGGNRHTRGLTMQVVTGHCCFRYCLSAAEEFTRFRVGFWCIFSRERAVGADVPANVLAR